MLGLAPLPPRRPPWLGLLPTCSPAAAWSTAASSSIFSLPSLSAKHLQSGSTGRLFSVCLGCDTIFILRFNDSSLYYYCLSHSDYLLSPGPATLPSFPRLAGAHANAGCFPSSPAQPSPRDPRALLCLLRTSLGPDVASPLHPLSPDLPRAAGGERGRRGSPEPTSYSPHSASLPSSVAHAKEGQGAGHA